MIENTHNSMPVSGRPQGRHARLRHLRTTGLRTLIALSAFGLTATAVAKDHVNVTRATTTRLRHWLQTGQASWYGLKFQGHRTSNGEKFDMNSLTCAHRTLPLGSWLRVTNMRNRKSVFVRVTDRGPVSGSRIVDLSYAAAHAVGLDGVGQVKLEAISPNDPEMARALVARLQLPLIPIPGR